MVGEIFQNIVNSGVIEQFPVIIVVISLISAITIPLVGRINKKIPFYVSFITILTQLVLSVLVLYRIYNIGTIHYWLGGWSPPWGIEYVIDPLNAYILVITLFLCLMAVIFSKENIKHILNDKKTIPFYTLFQLLVTGLCGMISTGDLFNMYVLLELTALSSYALVAVTGRKSLKASYNYLLMGSIGTCFFLLGIGLLYSITGSLNMHDISILLPQFYNNNVVKTAFVFFLVGLGIKMALFPFHTWLPDAHASAPSEISALLSGIIIEVAAYAFIRLAFSVFTPNFIIFEHSLNILSGLSAIAIIFGSVLAMMQKNLKRMLAYSSVSQMGYIMLAVSISTSAISSSPWSGLAPATMHILNHSLMKGCLFLSAGAFIYRLDLHNISDLAGISKIMPYSTFSFMLAAVSMIGIPPTVGFVSKLYIILACLDSKKFVFIFVILLSTVLNLLYFWRVIETVYMKKERKQLSVSESAHGDVPTSMLIPMVTLASLCIVMGILWLLKVPLPLLDRINYLFNLSMGVGL